MTSPALCNIYPPPSLFIAPSSPVESSTLALASMHAAPSPSPPSCRYPRQPSLTESGTHVNPQAPTSTLPHGISHTHQPGVRHPHETSLRPTSALPHAPMSALPHGVRHLRQLPRRHPPPVLHSQRHSPRHPPPASTHRGTYPQPSTQLSHPYTIQIILMYVCVFTNAHYVRCCSYYPSVPPLEDIFPPPSPPFPPYSAYTIAVARRR